MSQSLAEQELRADALTLHCSMTGLRTIQEAGTENRFYHGTLIRPGVYVPGVGNGGGLRVRFRKEVLQAMSPSMEGKKVNFEHSQGAIDEVGFVRGVIGQDGVVTGELVIQQARPRFGEAIGFIEGRIQANQVPELSVEIKNPVFRRASGREVNEFDLDLIGGEFDGTSLVSRGACSAEDGCGIGLCKKQCTGETGEEAASMADAEQSSSHIGHYASTGLRVQGESSMADHEEGCMKCGKFSAQLEAAQAAEAKAIEERDNAVTALEKAEEESKGLMANLNAYEEAESDALMAAIKDQLPKDANLTEMLGEAPTKHDLQLFLNALKATGSKPAPTGGGGGRRTTTTTRDSSPGKVYRQHYEAVRARLGLSSEGAVKLPESMQRHTREALQAQGLLEDPPAGGEA